jgi:hypothetical protein
MKLQVKTPPSLTEQTVTVEVSDPMLIGSTITGTTPPTTTTPPPVDPPPTTTPGLTGYGTIVSFKEFNTLDPAQLGKGKVVKSPTNPNQNVFNAIVDAGDPPISSGYRSEQNWDQTPTEGGCEFDIYFIKTYDSSLIWQIHGNTSGTSGVTSIWMAGNNKIQLITSDENHNNKYFPIDWTFSLNKWYHFRHEVFLSASGYHRLFIDKKLVVSVNGKMNDSKGAYGKIGINQFDNKGSSSILYDSFTIFKK